MFRLVRKRPSYPSARHRFTVAFDGGDEFGAGLHGKFVDVAVAVAIDREGS
jgi:hypothetical protein